MIIRQECKKLFNIPYIFHIGNKKKFKYFNKVIFNVIFPVCDLFFISGPWKLNEIIGSFLIGLILHAASYF